MRKILAAGLFVLMTGAIMAVGFGPEAPTTLAQAPTETPTPSATETPTAIATATPTASATATPIGTATVAATTTGTATATPRVQPAAVPVTGGDPSDGSLHLALILAIGIGAVAGSAGVLAARYALTRRS